MAATASIGLSKIGFNLEKLFIALFMFVFAILLFSFEAMQIWKYDALDGVYKRNFGFLYHPKGKALFIIL